MNKRYPHLEDKVFLKEIRKFRIYTKYIRVLILDYKENPIQEISGKITGGGNININGNSPMRRTINFSLIADDQIKNIKNLDNLISLNKKIYVEIGYDNPISQKYDKILWFPCGMYLIDKATLSRTTTNMIISISGRDKMCTLDGTVGGTFPYTVIFHERYNKEENGEILVEHPTIYQIILESLIHYGKENINNITISDLDNEAKILVRYNGEVPIWFNDSYSSFVFSQTKPINQSQSSSYLNKYTYGDDIGYMKTPFTYPGELTFQAGQTVLDLLNKICETLGNYEFYYDVFGHFIFQEKKNYLNHQYTPLTKTSIKDYLYMTYDTKYADIFLEDETHISYSLDPGYEKIKNDFIVLGTRTNSMGESYNIKYHLTVSKKPQLNKSKKYMFIISDKKTHQIIRYEYIENDQDKLNKHKEKYKNKQDFEIKIVPPGLDWREELYRNALENNLNSFEEGYFDQELLSEWRNIFDPANMDWKKQWQENYNFETWIGWNPEVYNNPSSLNYWLDFIDTNSNLMEYSIESIGTRTKVFDRKDISAVYNKPVKDIVFIKQQKDKESQIKEINKYNSMGQDYCILEESQLNYFSFSATSVSAFDFLKECLYQYLTYYDKINIVSALPIYYLEPNNLIYLRDKGTGIEGEYFIDSISLPLSYNGTMSISAIKNQTREQLI